jgi:hypothetical protein
MFGVLKGREEALSLFVDGAEPFLPKSGKN